MSRNGIIKRMVYALRTARYYSYIYTLKTIGSSFGVVPGSDSENYAFDILDYEIPHSMFRNKETFSLFEMQRFIFKIQQYNDSGEIVLDIGANIGTTSVHLSKKFKDYSIVAFEPDTRNYQLLKANIILNNCTNVTAVNVGISNNDSSLKMKTFNDSRGKNRIIESVGATSDDTVITIDTTSVDAYMANNGIKPEKIKAIWMDIEGHEPYAVMGMQRLLQERKIPFIMEFSPEMISEKMFDDMYKVLYRTYSEFERIDTGSHDVTVHKIDKLPDLYKEESGKQWNLLFI